MCRGYFKRHTSNDLISAALILAIVACTLIVLIGALAAARRGGPRKLSGGLPGDAPTPPADPLAHHELGSLG